MSHKWLIRPSQMGKLMSSSRSKDQIFGDTALKVIKQNAYLYKRGVEPEITTNYKMEKGIHNESINIDLASEVLKWKGVKGSDPKVRKSNDYFIGEPDVNTPDLLADIKSSWNHETFPILKNPNNPDYIKQLNCYMDLTGKDQAELVYVLSDHPDHLISKMIQSKSHYYNERPFLFPEAEGIEHLWSLAEEKAEKEILSQGIFSHIPKEKRVKRYIIERDQDLIDKMKERIDLAREEFDRIYEKI